MADVHVLLVYSLRDQKLVDQRIFEAANVDEAVEAYLDAERQDLRDRELEIVLIGADSLETIHRTHNSYFAGDIASVLKELDSLALG